MKKNLFAKLAGISLAAVLSVGAIACTVDPGNSSDAGGLTRNFKSSNEFFAMSAASGVSFLDAESGSTRVKKARAVGMKSESAGKILNENLNGNSSENPSENGGENAGESSEILARPSEYTDESVAEIRNCLVLFDSVVGGGVNFEVGENSETDGAYASYGFRMTVNFGGESAVMYYDETGTKTEVDDDETEEKTTLKGVLVSGNNVYDASGIREIEKEADEKEYSLELLIKRDAASYVKFSYETESEKGKNETEYKCEIFENGRKIQETEIEIEEKNGKTEIKFELEKNGKGDGVEYEIVKRSEGAFDIVREENGKKSYVLAEKQADGYKFTYSNLFVEIVPFVG